MIAAARAALHLLLTTDPQFVAAMQALNLGATGVAAVPKVLKGNRRFDQIGQENYPCWMSDAGDMVPAPASDVGDPMGLTINSHQQEWTADFELALVWHAQTFETSVDQTDALLQPLVQLLLRNPDLNGICAQAYVAATAGDLGARHPLHVFTATVRVHFVIKRA